MPSKNENKKNRLAITLAVITVAGASVVALINIFPTLFANASSTNTGHNEPKTSPSPITVTGDNGATQTVVTGDHNSVVVSNNSRTEKLLEQGLPASDHPVVDLSKPIEAQIQLFPEDKVEVVGFSNTIESIWLGNNWESVSPNSGKIYTVWGKEGQPVTPQLKGTGSVKLKVSFTKNRDKLRDLRPHIPNAPVEKK